MRPSSTGTAPSFYFGLVIDPVSTHFAFSFCFVSALLYHLFALYEFACIQSLPGAGIFVACDKRVFGYFKPYSLHDLHGLPFRLKNRLLVLFSASGWRFRL